MSQRVEWLGLVGEAPDDPRSDEELVEAWGRGEPGAADALWARYVRFVARWCWRMGVAPDDEDAWQEAALGWILAVRAWRPERGTLTTVAAPWVTGRVRRRPRPFLTILDEPDLRLDDDVTRGELVPDPDAQVSFERAEGTVWVEQVLGLLPAAQAEVMRVRLGLRGGDRRLEAAGQRLGFSRQRAHVLERRALERLRSLQEAV